jgi:pimeloyl-ACP methyl ester carboxylesterase
MLAVIEDAGIPSIHWAGNSLGGIVGLAMVGRAPGRFASLATFGTAFSLRLPRPLATLFPLIYGLAGKRLVARAMARVTTDVPAARRLIAEMAEAFEPMVGKAVGVNLCRYDLISAALGYQGPMLMIRGGRDHGINATLGPTLKAMRQRPNFRSVALAHAGHCANLDRPEEVRGLLERFWREVAEPAVGAPSSSVAEHLDSTRRID